MQNVQIPAQVDVVDVLDVLEHVKQFVVVHVEQIVVVDKITKQERQIAISGLFIAIGQMPENAIFSNLVTLNEGGYIVAMEDCKTNIDGIFAAGDTRTKAIRQLTTAAADGAVAALAACEYIG